jgi:hypothetical protein
MYLSATIEGEAQVVNPPSIAQTEPVLPVFDHDERKANPEDAPGRDQGDGGSFTAGYLPHGALVHRRTSLTIAGARHRRCRVGRVEKVSFEPADEMTTRRKVRPRSTSSGAESELRPQRGGMHSRDWHWQRHPVRPVRWPPISGCE